MTEAINHAGTSSANLAGDFPVHIDPPPLRVDGDGVVRVGNGRITLDLIVEEYESGLTPEDIVQAFDVLTLTDVYGAIAYYLRHREEVQTYLKRRNEEADALRRKIETTQKPQVTRAELTARKIATEKANTEQANAATGQ